MRKKEDLYDYKNFDYISAAVDKNGAAELSARYAALGWECAESKEDRIYRNLLHVTLRRPHSIAHKDELQLLQVYLESALNKIGKINAYPCPKTLFFGLFFGLVSLALIVTGICGAFGLIKSVSRVFGFVLLGLGILSAVLTAVLSFKMHGRELRISGLEKLTAEQEIAFVDIAAKKLLANNTAKEAADE